MGLSIYPGLPRGDDVSCGVNFGAVAVTVFATRYTPPKTPEAVLRESLNAMRGRISDLTPFTGTTAHVEPPSKPGHVAPSGLTTLRFTGTLNGKPIFTRSSAAACGAWMIAERVTAPADAAMASPTLRAILGIERGDGTRSAILRARPGA